ncbi:MAG: type IV secretion system DNA-binding domain-containing protein [bacterium]|nr:type IV secretion system DNA-binding domain-containing protein [bacterium]
MPYVVIVVGILFISVVLAWRAAKKLEGGKSSQISNGVLLSITLPRLNEKLPTAAEQMFASLHGILDFTPDVQEHLSLEMASSPDGIRFYVFTPNVFKNFVESQIYAQYPAAEIREAIDYTKSLPAGSFVSATELSLGKDFIFPIKTFRDFEVDPLAAITSALAGLKEGEQLWVQILIRPVDDFWQDRGHEYVQMVREGISPVTLNPQDIVIDVGKHILSLGGNVATNIMRGPQPVEEPRAGSQFVRLSAGQELTLKMLENKLSKIGFEIKIRLIAVAGSREKAETSLSGLISSFKQFSTADLNSFVAEVESPSPEQIVKEYQERDFAEREAGHFILNTEELASIFHLPNLSVETPTITWTGAKKGEPPLNLPLSEATVIGETIFRDDQIRFGIKKADRRKHVYIIGKTGTGKSTLIKNMIIQDMRAGEGVAVLDPHGQLIDEILDFVPENRLDDVVIFNPADADYPVSLNMLQIVDPRQRTLVGDTLVDVFKKYFADSWGPRLEYILKNCILTLLEVPNTSLLSITRLLMDRDYRKYIVGLINDPQMRAFWNNEYARMEQNERLITEAISPIQNKVGQFLNSELIRNIVGQPKSSIKVDEIINSGKLFFVNLATGRIGANNTALLGAMIVSQLQFAAMRRVDIPESTRRDFFLYADEFQNFATDAFATVLSEARKYRLDLTLTHQYIEQMPEAVRDAVFGNIGTLICFTIGPTDAHFLEREFEPVFLQNDLINLGRYEMYLKLQVDDTQGQPFSARSLPPATNATGLRERAVAASRSKYGRPVEGIEKIIKKWTETKFRPGQAPMPPAWAVKEEQKVQEVPVEGEPAATPDLSPQLVPSPQQPEQTAPKPFTRENIPGFAENQSLVSHLPEKSGEVDIYRFPEIKSGSIYQPREADRNQSERPFPKRSEEDIASEHSFSRENQPEKN